MDEVCSVCCFGDGDSFAYDPNPNSFNDLPNFSDYPPQLQYETYSCELYGNDSHHGYDCPPRFPLAANIDQSPLQEMSIQDMEDLKQHYLDEMLSLSNDLQIKDYRNEKLDIRFRRECESMIDELKESTIPLNEIISQIPSSIAITPILLTLEPEDSLIMGNEELNTIPEKESDEVIKSSVENLVPIPSEFEDTSESDSDCDLPSCDDFSPINVSKEKFVTFSNPLFNSNDDFTSSDDESLSDEDVLEDNVKIYSNPLFEFDDEYISSDVNPLFDEVLENIESKDSYVSNLDEPALLVTPLSDFNEDECFDPGGDVDEIEFLLHRDPSSPMLSVASILEGFTDEPPLEENDDLFDLESKENEWKKILYDASIDDLMTEDKDCPDFEDSRARDIPSGESKGNQCKSHHSPSRALSNTSEITQEVLNAAAGGIFLYKTLNQAYQLLEDKVLLKLDLAKNQKTKTSLKKTVAFTDEGNSNTDTNKIMARMDVMTIKMDAQYKELQSRAKQPTPNLDDDDIPMSREEEAKFMQTFCKTRFYNDYRDRDANRDNWRSRGRNDYNRDNHRSNTDDKPYDLQKQFNDFMKSQQSTNAFAKKNIHGPQTQLETVAKNHQASIQNIETKFDKLADKQSGRPSRSLPSNTQQNPRGSNSKAYQPPQARNEHANVVFTRSGKTYNPPENPNEEQNKTENPINFDSYDEDDKPTPQPNIQTQKPVKETPLPKPYKPKIIDESSAMIQNKVPPKLRDPGSFLIPCNFNKTFSCNALADLAENMLVEVGKFTFPVDFVILEMEEDSKVPLILGRPFLYTADAVIRVKHKQLNLGVGTERMIFIIDSAMKHSYSNDDTYFSIDEILKEDFDALLDEGSKILHSIEGTLLEEEIFSEFNEFIAMAEDENSESESDTEEPPF
ncbi:reverse transcriptase domain-containing protein [Tanacetum coccineum]